MKNTVKYAYLGAKLLLRLTPILILAMLLYTCFYIYKNAPDGGTMLAFRRIVADLLGHAIASTGLLFAAGAIPDVNIL